MTTQTSAAHPSRLEWGLAFAFWAFLGMLTVGTRLLDPRSGSEGMIDMMRAGRVFAGYFLWALVTPYIFRIAARYVPDRERLLRTIGIHVCTGLLVAISIDLATDLIRVYLFPPDRETQFIPLQAIARFWFINELVVYSAILATGFARVYYLRQRQREEEAAELEQEANELRAQKAELEAQLSAAQLEALRMQLNPHFLFNTLHAVSTLVGRDPKGVRRMIARLSTLLRYVLEESTQQEVPLRDEVGFLRGYLEIQEVRFQGHLDVDIQIDAQVEPALVPTLILQPIVENAIKHGVSTHPDVGQISVTARRNGDQLVLVVADNGSGLDAPSSPLLDRGTGLSNVKARLKGLYGDAHRLVFDTATLGGLRVTITLPYHEEDDLYAPAVEAGAAREGDPLPLQPEAPALSNSPAQQ